jgi:signal transduction histidine kinase
MVVENGVEGIEALRSALARAGSAGDAAERAHALVTELRSAGVLDELAELVAELADELESSRRQFKRLGFDLHDGPLQDVAALGTDLHFFRDQLGSESSGAITPHLLVGRVDDLLARLVALDTDLRRLAIDVEASSVAERNLRAALADAAAGTGSCDVTLNVDDDLDADEMTASQRIAVIRIVQGALANVARHSGAKSATVTVRALPGGIEAEVLDDGGGFDVDTTMQVAVENSRLGLVAMRERVRFLDGEFSVDSQPGGPTRVRVFLPHWRRRGAPSEELRSSDG